MHGLTPMTARRIGRDVVHLGEGRLVVESPVDMPDWQVREHRRQLVHYAGRTWRIAAKTAASETTVRYELVPWTPAELELIGAEIRYGPDYVARRDRELRQRRRTGRVALALELASPLVGLLFSQTKMRLQERYGLDAMTATSRSLYLEYLILLLSATCFVIGVVAGGLGGAAPLPPGPLIAVALVVAPDALVRWDRLLREQRYPPGFYEWLWR